MDELLLVDLNSLLNLHMQNMFQSAESYILVAIFVIYSIIVATAITYITYVAFSNKN